MQETVYYRIDQHGRHRIGKVGTDAAAVARAHARDSVFSKTQKVVKEIKEIIWEDPSNVK